MGRGTPVQDALRGHAGQEKGPGTEILFGRTALASDALILAPISFWWETAVGKLCQARGLFACWCCCAAGGGEGRRWRARGGVACCRLKRGRAAAARMSDWARPMRAFWLRTCSSPSRLPSAWSSFASMGSWRHHPSDGSRPARCVPTSGRRPCATS